MHLPSGSTWVLRAYCILVANACIRWSATFHNLPVPTLSPRLYIRYIKNTRRRHILITTTSWVAMTRVCTMYLPRYLTVGRVFVAATLK
ncbi:hypothetical protein F5X98DRAFT_219251 [Xylaria grammica]|nr:hypothetical protein F5X98DRAFT_219251 [Xylaria grammica]